MACAENGRFQMQFEYIGCKLRIAHEFCRLKFWMRIVYICVYVHKIVLYFDSSQNTFQICMSCILWIQILF